jgi:hypothetical protein
MVHRLHNPPVPLRVENDEENENPMKEVFDTDQICHPCKVSTCRRPVYCRRIVDSWNRFSERFRELSLSNKQPRPLDFRITTCYLLLSDKCYNPALRFARGRMIYEGIESC